jgi:hypothetical protein
MREPVRSDDAVLFTKAFYDQLLPEFERMLDHAQEDEPVDWARLLVDARHQLAEQYEPLSDQLGTKKEWTLPVVYTRPSVFRLQVPTTAVEPPASTPPGPPDQGTRAAAPPSPAPAPSGPPGSPLPAPQEPTIAGSAPEPTTGAGPPADGESAGAGTQPETAGSLDVETTRSIVLSIDALTGLRNQLENSGDTQMLDEVDRELAALIDRLEGR